MTRRVALSLLPFRAEKAGSISNPDASLSGRIDTNLERPYNFYTPPRARVAHW